MRDYVGYLDRPRTHIYVSEQLYQALRRLEREVEMVVYPEQHHGIDRPTDRLDLYERYIEWYDRYVMGEGGVPEDRAAGS